MATIVSPLWHKSPLLASTVQNEPSPAVPVLEDGEFIQTLYKEVCGIRIQLSFKETVKYTLGSINSSDIMLIMKVNLKLYDTLVSIKLETTLPLFCHISQTWLSSTHVPGQSWLQPGPVSYQYSDEVLHRTVGTWSRQFCVQPCFQEKICKTS